MITSTTTAISALSALALVAASSFAFAANETAPAAAPATSVAPAVVKANPEDKLICKTETPIGSRLGGKRTCMKKSEWEAQSRIESDQLRFRPPAGISSTSGMGGSH